MLYSIPIYCFPYRKFSEFPSLLVLTRYPYHLFSFMEDNLDNKALFSSRSINAFLTFCTYGYLILCSSHLHLGQAFSSALSYHLIALTKGQRRTWIFELEKNCESSVFNTLIIIKQVFLTFFPNTQFYKVAALSMITSSQRTCIWLPSFPFQMSQEGNLKVCTYFSSSSL